ncbi:MAG: SH3 domain-containing protein [Clostridia bacterium]|nr:SH3 domain-containing protein [Clostridia bacterium]
MPEIFLSPSLQPFNPYVNGGNEAQIMGYLADALEPYLTVNNIGYTRSRYPNTLANAISSSNAGNYDLHLALHSNASPEASSGRFRGVQAYYYPTSAQGKAAAQDLVEAMKTVYPDPDLVYTVPSTVITEVRRTKAPAVLMEIGYHDNLQDADWIKANIQNIAQALAQGLTDYFNLPFFQVCATRGEVIANSPQISTNAYVSVCTNDGSLLNIRSEPNLNSQILGQIPSGNKALLLERPNNAGWAKVRYNVIEGYASANFLCRCIPDTQATTGVVTTDGGNLNLRSAPTLTSSIIGRIPNKTVITILETQGAWYKVNFMGATGFVLSDFVKLQSR